MLAPGSPLLHANRFTPFGTGFSFLPAAAKCSVYRGGERVRESERERDFYAVTHLARGTAPGQAFF